MQKLLETRQAMRQVEVQSKDPEVQKAEEIQRAKQPSDSEDSDAESGSEESSKSIKKNDDVSAAKDEQTNIATTSKINEEPKVQAD